MGKHRVLTFESTPRWHKIPATSSPVEQIRNLQRAPWGGSTNFAAAMDLLLAACAVGDAPRAVKTYVVGEGLRAAFHNVLEFAGRYARRLYGGRENTGRAPALGLLAGPAEAGADRRG